MAEPLHAFANAKLNLGLIVRGRRADGFHHIVSLAQSVSWADELSLAASETDDFEVAGMADDGDNLAWRAVIAVRSAAGADHPIALRLQKHIPVAAGLGGGSADAAAALGMAASLLGLDEGQLAALAEELGSDVPFCLTGGLAVVEGRGELISPEPLPAADYAAAIVVPPVELATADVYAEWDRLDSPEGETIPASVLPPSLRRFEPLRNDLEPPARSLSPEVADWQGELASAWARPVMMTGSGPALYGFFLDSEEADAALEAIPAGSRGWRAARPVARGWELSSGTLTGPN